jgi:hypothetical protein
MTSDEQPADAQPGSSASSRRPLFALFSVNVISSVGTTSPRWPYRGSSSTPPAAPLAWALRERLLALADAVAVLAGPLVDRLGFKRASVLADIASGATVAAVPPALPSRHPPVLAAPCPRLPFVQHQYARRFSPFRFDTCPCPSGSHGYRTRQRRGSSHRSPGPDRGSAAGRRTDHSAGAANGLLLDALTFTTSATVVALGMPSALIEHRVKDVGGRLAYLRKLRDGLRLYETTR